MDKINQLSEKIRVMDNQYTSLDEKIKKNKVIKKQLEENISKLTKNFNEITHTINRDNATLVELKDIIAETRDSHAKIKEATDTLIEIIDVKYKI